MPRRCDSINGICVVPAARAERQQKKHQPKEDGNTKGLVAHWGAEGSPYKRPPPHWSISGRTSDSRRDMHSILCKEIKNLYKLCTMNEQQQSRSRAESVPVPVPVPVAVAAQGGECASVLAGQQLPKIVAVRLARSLTMATTANGT